MKSPRDIKTPVVPVAMTSEHNDSNEHDGRVNGNGHGHGSMHPEAVEALAKATAQKQAADEQWITRVDGGIAEANGKIDRLMAGDTDWQREVKAAMSTLTDALWLIKIAVAVKPAARTVALLLLGGAFGELIWRLTSH